MIIYKSSVSQSRIRSASSCKEGDVIEIGIFLYINYRVLFLHCQQVENIREVPNGSKIRIDHMIDQNNRELSTGSYCSHIVVTTKLCEICLERNCFGIIPGKSLTIHWLAVMGRRRKRGLDTGMTICCMTEWSMKNMAC